MAQPSIHDVSATEFKAFSPSKAIDFLATVTEPWMDSNLSDEVILPDSYVVMVDRRTRQLAKATDQPVEDVEAKILARAREIRADVLAANEKAEAVSA